MQSEAMTGRAVHQVAARAAVLGTVLALVTGGCSGPPGPPPIAIGTRCALCDMAVETHHFACEREVGGRMRVYDSIECLLRDRTMIRGGEIYLPDYDQGTLHPPDSLWVVHGNFPTPMGGGLAAFLSRAAADDLAKSTKGSVGRLDTFGDLDGDTK